MDSFTDLLAQTGVSVASYGLSYAYYKNDHTNKFTRYSLVSGFSLTAVGFTLLATKSACRFLKAG